ncbi:MAG: phage protease, partial [Kiritimatiellales bacterium]
MNLILNRNFELPADGWHQLAPLGEFPHAAAGIVQVIDAAACTLMVAAFENARAGSSNFPGLLIDFDHFSLDAEKRSEAAGWITDLKFMPNSAGSGLFARIRWSDIGEAAVKGGRYRFLSPVWAKSDCEDLGSQRLRPVRLLNAAVTNDPNLKG